MTLPRGVRDRAACAALDAIAAASPRKRATSPRTRIGVFLMWGVGDAVLTIPFLRDLRAAYPQANIAAIGKPWLADLFAGEGVFDGFDVLVPPWTRHSGKYRLWSKEWREFARTVRALSRTPFDLLVSLRPDPREAALARSLSAAEFAGYARSGARGWVTTDLGRLVADESTMYRGELAALAAAAVFGKCPPTAPQLLNRRPPASLAARLVELRKDDRPVLAVAFGAAHPIRRWRGERIAETLGKLRRKPAAYLLVEADDSPHFEPPANAPTLRWRGSLRDLKGALSLADVLFCSDSGAMHIGAAVGCRTVSVFGPGSRVRFAPPGPDHRSYAVEPMPCRPCYDNCIYQSPLCMDRVDTASVAALLDDALAAVGRPDAQPLRAVGTRT